MGQPQQRRLADSSPPVGMTICFRNDNLFKDAP
jgi:hypothetical protein